jgi:hypothetical protein
VAGHVAVAGPRQKQNGLGTAVVRVGYTLSSHEPKQGFAPTSGQPETPLMPASEKKSKRSKVKHKLEHKAAPRTGTARPRSKAQPKLARHQMAELRKFARDRGTSIATELSNAVDAYVLGIAPTDVGKLDEALEKLGAGPGRKRRKPRKR